jgi:hypothetical protein
MLAASCSMVRVFRVEVSMLSYSPDSQVLVVPAADQPSCPVPLRSIIVQVGYHPRGITKQFDWTVN